MLLSSERVKTVKTQERTNLTFDLFKLGGLHVLEAQYVCMYGQHFQQSMGHPGMVVNPARGQLSRKKDIFPVPVRA